MKCHSCTLMVSAVAAAAAISHTLPAIASADAGIFSRKLYKLDVLHTETKQAAEVHLNCYCLYMSTPLSGLYEAL